MSYILQQQSDITAVIIEQLLALLNKEVVESFRTCTEFFNFFQMLCTQVMSILCASTNICIVEICMYSVVVLCIANQCTGTMPVGVFLIVGTVLQSTSGERRFCKVFNFLIRTTFSCWIKKC